MEKFRENLEDFAAKHKNEIKKNPQFRKQFQEMCASIGVDPLASGKGEYITAFLPFSCSPVFLLLLSSLLPCITGILDYKVHHRIQNLI